MKFNNNNKSLRLEKISVALIWTKFQYHILLALLRELNIDVSSVVLIVASKAQKHGVRGDGFFKVIYYDIEGQSINHWFKIKNNILKILESFNFIPQNIFLRNYDSCIGRLLLSHYPEANKYLFEDGTASYKKRNFLAYPSGVKNILKNILLRLFFSSGTLKIYPMPIANSKKAGLFKNVDSWFDVPFIQIHLQKTDFVQSFSESNEEQLSYKVIILEQPLWQAGISERTMVDAYKKLFIYIKEQYNIHKEVVALKVHPSSNIDKVNNILEKLPFGRQLSILDTKENLEEMILSNQLKSVQMIIGFVSSGLYIAKALVEDEDVKVVCFSTLEFEKKFKELYNIFEEMGIKHIKEKIK